MYAQRIKELRKRNNMTQVQLAEKLGVSKGTVAMWETGQRRPSFDLLVKLCSIFDKRIDYILGYSDDESPANLTEEEKDALGCLESESLLHEQIMRYLLLDDYGRLVIDNLINMEYQRCQEQKTLRNKDDFFLRVHATPC